MARHAFPASRRVFRSPAFCVSAGGAPLPGGRAAPLGPFRFSARDRLREIPAGTRDTQAASARACVRRERTGAIGFRARRPVSRFGGDLPPGCGGEYRTCSPAGGLSLFPLPPNEGDRIEPVLPSRGDALAMIARGILPGARRRPAAERFDP